jgi:hypothetical protein
LVNVGPLDLRAIGRGEHVAPYCDAVVINL